MTEDTAEVAPSLNTTLLMSGSAIYLGSLGVGISLVPRQILAYVGVQPEESILILVSLIGALYLGFALQNWMARNKLIGGIYSRPVAVGNFIHFFAAGMMLSKQLITGSADLAFAAVTAGYVLFAAGFGYIVMAGGSSCG